MKTGKNTVFYEKDIEAMGGGVLLEKMIKKGFYRNLYQGILYLKGRKYKIKIMTYRRGKGKIVEIALPGDREAEIQYLIDIYRAAVQSNEGNLYNIRQGRKITNYLSSICITLQIYLIALNIDRLIFNTASLKNILIIILCTFFIPLTVLKKERALRF